MRMNFNLLPECVVGVDGVTSTTCCERAGSPAQHYSVEKGPTFNYAAALRSCMVKLPIPG